MSGEKFDAICSLEVLLNFYLYNRNISNIIFYY